MNETKKKRNKKRNLVMLALMICFMAFCSTERKADAATNYENISVGMGEQITKNGEVKENEKKIYTLTTDSATCSYLMAAKAEDEDIIVSVYDSMNRQIDDFSAGSEGKSVEIKLNKNATYFIEVECYYCDKENYLLSISKRADEPDTLMEAAPVSVGNNEMGYLCAKDDQDWYKFTTASELSCYTITGVGQSAYITFALLDQNGKELERESYVGTAGESIITKLSPNTTYYISIKPSGGYTGNYSFCITATKDEPDTLKTAKTVSVGKVNQGNICTDSDVDYYKFKTGSQKANYILDAWSLDGYINASLYDKNGKEIGYNNYIGTQGKTMKVSLAANRYYYVKITGASYYQLDYKFQIKQEGKAKSSQKIKVSTTSKNISYKKLKKTNQSFQIKATAKTTKKFKKISGSKKITVNSKGKVTVKKGLKKGTYSVKVKVTAASSSKYKSASKTVTIKVRVK